MGNFQKKKKEKKNIVYLERVKKEKSVEKEPNRHLIPRILKKLFISEHNIAGGGPLSMVFGFLQCY